MVDSTVNIQSKQRGDVTPQIISYAELYGSSDNTNQNSTASSRTLQYATGSTVQKPVHVPVKTAPQLLTFQNPTGVGLFGAEMVVLRFDLDIKDSGKLDNCGPIGIDLYFPACVHRIDQGTVNTYQQLEADQYADLIEVNSYEPALFSNTGVLDTLHQPMIKVGLKNLGSGNQYQDCWVDAYFLGADRKVMAETEFWTPLRSSFYLSISARNTRRMPYNLEVSIGDQITSLNSLSPVQRNEANLIS